MTWDVEDGPCSQGPRYPRPGIVSITFLIFFFKVARLAAESIPKLFLVLKYMKRFSYFKSIFEIVL